MRKLLRTGTSAVVLLALMFTGSLVLWIGVPLAWLWVGSQVQGATHSVGAAIGIMAVGVIATIAAIVPMLGWLSHKHAELRVARGLEPHGNVALEGILVVSAVLALAVFLFWFFTQSGSSPIPVNDSYL